MKKVKIERNVNNYCQNCGFDVSLVYPARYAPSAVILSGGQSPKPKPEGRPLAVGSRTESEMQPDGLMICNLCEVGDIHGCAVMHTVFNGILRYSACTTDK